MGVLLRHHQYFESYIHCCCAFGCIEKPNLEVAVVVPKLMNAKARRRASLAMGRNVRQMNIAQHTRVGESRQQDVQASVQLDALQEHNARSTTPEEESEQGCQQANQSGLRLGNAALGSCPAAIAASPHNASKTPAIPLGEWRLQ